MGVVDGGTTSLNLGSIIMKDISIIGITVFNAPRRNLETVANLAARGRLRPVIDRTFPH